MTEYELMDIAETINGNSITATGVYFSILTAYLLVAYIVGNQLTKYQVAFINTIFLFYNFVALTNLAMMVRNRMGVSERLAEISGNPMAFGDEASLAVILVFVLMRLMLIAGAIGFMWQIRHPKAK